METNLPPHQILDPERQIPDRPLAQRLRVRESQRLGHRCCGLPPRGGRLRRPPRDPPAARLPLLRRIPCFTSFATNLRFLDGEPAAEGEVEQHRHAGGRGHRRGRHRRIAEERDGNPRVVVRFMVGDFGIFAFYWEFFPFLFLFLFVF